MTEMEINRQKTDTKQIERIDWRSEWEI